MLNQRNVIQFITYRFLTGVAFALISQSVCVYVAQDVKGAGYGWSPIVFTSRVTPPGGDIQTTAYPFRYFSVLDSKRHTITAKIFQQFFMMSTVHKKKIIMWINKRVE